jgi:hypothetical protein
MVKPRKFVYAGYVVRLYLFIVYLTTLSVAQAVQHRMLG